MSDDPCADALEVLYHYLDGEITQERRVTITTHIDECGSCLEVFEFHTELKAVVRRRTVTRVPESLRNKIARELGITGV